MVIMPPQSNLSQLRVTERVIRMEREFLTKFRLRFRKIFRRIAHVCRAERVVCAWHLVVPGHGLLELLDRLIWKSCQRIDTANPHADCGRISKLRYHFRKYRRTCVRSILFQDSIAEGTQVCDIRIQGNGSMELL